MKFVHRLGYYLGGFAIGLIFLAFFLSGKRTSCDYGPEARVLKNINTKTLVTSDKVKSVMNTQEIDSTTLNTILRHGKVNFKASNTQGSPCNFYVIEGEREDETNIVITVENCDTQATVTDLQIQK